MLNNPLCLPGRAPGAPSARRWTGELHEELAHEAGRVMIIVELPSFKININQFLNAPDPTALDLR